jgi:LPS-assembly lipoprotein
MWWLKRLVSTGLLLGLGLTLGLSLAACGFRPMYGKSSADPAVMNELASIQVATIKDRNGQLLHNALLTGLNPKGEPQHPAYQLIVSLTTDDSAMATLPDDTASRNLVTYTAVYTLYQKGKTLAQGTATKEVSYDYLKQHFSDITAQESVNKRAADQVAAEIRNDLAAYFIRAAEVKRGEVRPVQ